MQKIATPQGSIAYRESAGRGAATILIHGNSSSSSVFARQLEGSLGARRRLIALDLPGHGASDDNLAAYSLRGYARAVRTLIDALGVEDAHILGWSLGGHIALELAPDLPRARGFVISGTPPLGFPPAMEEAFLPSPAMAFSFEEKLDRQQAAAYAAAGFRPGAADIPESFVQDILRTDGRARSGLAASIAPDSYHDEIEVAASLKAPLAVLQGAEEQLVNAAYIAALKMPTLWRGAVQVIPDAGHTPHWEAPEAFDALLDAFLTETT